MLRQKWRESFEYRQSPMWTRQRKSRRYGALIMPAIAAVFLSYFGYHAFHGDYGIYAAKRLAERTDIMRGELASLRAQRAELEHRLSLLSNGTMERDMLDQQARRVLNLVREDEVVIFRTGAMAN